jgi:hypothetical protein
MIDLIFGVLVLVMEEAESTMGKQLANFITCS